MSRSTRTLGRALAAATALGIAVLTLTPQPAPQAVTFGHGCLVCGATGGADVIANVALFIPFGLALVFAGLSWWRATLVAMALSVGIELAQYLFVSGRFATASDVVTNTLGALLGATVAYWRHTWTRPGPRAAAGLTALAAGAWLGALGFGAWAMGRDAITGPTIVAPSPFGYTPGFGWFDGAIERASVNDLAVAHRGTGPVIFEGRLGADVTAVVAGTGRDERRDVIPLVFFHERGDSLPRLLLAQYGSAAVFRLQLRGNRIRLRQIGMTVPNVFTRAARTQPYTLTGTASEDSIALSVVDEQGTRTRRSVIHLKPTLGWAILSPIPRVDSRLASLATAAWIAGLAFPLGYWARWAARSPTGRATRQIGASAFVVAALVVGLAIVPGFGGFPVASGSEWFAAVAGAVAGALAMGVMRERGRTRAR